MWHRVTLVRLNGHFPVKRWCCAGFADGRVGRRNCIRNGLLSQGLWRQRIWTCFQSARWQDQKLGFKGLPGQDSHAGVWGQSSSSWQRNNWWLASKDQWVTKKVGFNICPGQRRTMASSLSVKLDLSSPHRRQLGWSHAASHRRRRWGSGEGSWPQAPSHWTTERRGGHRKHT